MWRFLLLGILAVSTAERWSRQTSDRRLSDWVPVSAPCLTCHPQQKGRSYDQDVAGTGSELASILTPPPQQPNKHHSRSPMKRDNFYQASSHTGFFAQPQYNAENPKQFVQQQQQNFNAKNNNNQPIVQSSIRFKSNSPISDSSGFSSNIFQVGPQQYSQNLNQQSSHLLPINQFNSGQFIAPPLRTQFSGNVNAPLLQHNLQPFNDFHLPPNPPVFFPPEPVDAPLQQQFNNNFYNQIPLLSGQNVGLNNPISNISFNNKQPTDVKGKEEIQLLYVPVETLHRQNQKGRNVNVKNNENKKVEANNLQNNNFRASNQSPVSNSGDLKTPKQIYQEKNVESGEQYFKQSQSIPENLQPHNLPAIQETLAPQIQQNSFSQPIFQEQISFGQGVNNQQQEIITSSPSSNNNNNIKFQYEQFQSDNTFNVNNPQITHTYQQGSVNGHFKSADPKYETSNTNYYQSQQHSQKSESNFNPEYRQQDADDQEGTTPAPHQPPLSVYMENNPHSKITDVLAHLKTAKTIPVLDTFGPDSPQVFVGPSNLSPPSGYLKFELPYLSSLDNNRVERKVDQLPFFVAPLNFQPPPGYSKIPFPAPHIGSVVVSNATVFKAALHEKPSEVFQFETTTTPYEINQYTVPSNISPISPSLVNSLQDERYIPTTEIPITTLLSTTQVYTTPRRRVPTRGSHRAYTTTTTSEPSITRRPSTRQRRPNNRPNSSFRNQQSETTISTQEPVISTTINSPFYEEKNREQYTYVEKQSEYPQTSNQNYRQPNVNSNNQNHQESPENQNEQQQFYNGQSNFNVHQNNKFPTNVPNFNNVLQPQSIPQSDVSELEQQKQFHSQLPNQQQYIQGIQEEKQINIPQQQQFKTAGTDLRQTDPQQKYTQYLQENYELPHSNSNSDKQNPVINGNYQNNENDYIPKKEFVSDSPNTESTLKETTQHALENNSENDNKFNNFRRDPLRQRFRGKSHYQTTTDHPTRNTEIVQLRQRAKHRPQHNQNVQIVNDDTYNHKFNYPTNTERIDEQSTEHNEELQYNPNTNNNNYFKNDEQQFVNIQGAHAKNRPSLSDNGQFYQEQYTRVEQSEGFKQNEQNLSDGQEKLTEAIQTQGNLNVQPQYQYDLNQNQQSNKEQQFNVELENSTPQSYVRETTPISVPNFHNSQQIFSDSSSKYDEIDQVTEKPINQQRLVKYTRVQGSTINPNVETDVKESNGDQVNLYNKDSSSVQQNNYNTQLANNQFSNQDLNEPITEAEPVEVTTTTTTENPPLVRVRGRVRNRQRLNGPKHTTTTDAPNYPAGTNVEDHSDSQFLRKSQHHRINYSERNNNRKTTKFKNSNLHSNLNRDNHENSELESSPRYTTTSTDNDEVSVSKTVDSTTTEIPVSRKYNHILNRNIVRRPVSSRTSNQGTTSTSSLTGSTSKYLVRTTRRPTTQVTRLTEGGARIRRPNKLITTTSTTEYTPSNVKQDNFPPSAASNEVLDPYYPQKDNYNNHQTSSYNRQSYQTVNRNPSKQYTHPSYETSTFLTPTPFSPPPTSNNNENYWDDIVTIQQSNSYDFSAESSPVTHSTLSTLHKFQDEEYDQKSSPVFKNPSPVYNNDDQTPFSSNDQYIASHSKNKLISPVYSGKHSQFSEKEEDRRLVQNEKGSIDTINQSPEEYRYPQEQQNYNNKAVNNYYIPQVNNKEALVVTEKAHSHTVFPSDSIPEQTENNRQFSITNINDQEKTDHKSDLTDEESQFSQESIEDTYNENDNFKKNVDGKPINPVNSKKAGKRRGSWVRVRVNKKSKDVFETAESQNLASISNENTIKSNEGKGESVKENYIPANHRPTDLYNTENPQTIRSPSTIVTTTTENPTESKNDNNIQKQKSLTEMIRDIINSEDVSNEEEEVDSEIHEDVNNFDIGKVNKNANQNNSITTTSQPNLKTDVSETTVTFIPENLAVTVIPDINQVSTEGVESITALPEIVTSEINTEESKVLGTSTTTEISLETEICYRGRCIKSKKNNKKPIKPLFGSYKTSKLSLSDVVKQTDSESDLMPIE